MTEETLAHRPSSSLSTEIQSRYGLTEEQAKKVASDPDFAVYLQSSMRASSASSTLIEDLKAAAKELEELVSRMSAG